MKGCAYNPIKTDREDGRFMHTDIFMKHYYKTHRPKLEYKSGMSVEEFGAWREKIKDAYATLGAPDAFEFYYHEAFDSPEKRPYYNKPAPECATDAEYDLYTNVPQNAHYFKKDLALPWVNRLCGREDK